MLRISYNNKKEKMEKNKAQCATWIVACDMAHLANWQKQKKS